MSQINNVANVELIKYGLYSIGVLSAVINALIIYIFQGFKKDHEKLKIRVYENHDRLGKVEVTCDIYHPKNGN